MNRPASVPVEIERVTSASAIARVAALAREIWTEHYTPIIGAEQVAYMLANLQSPEAIAQQIRDGHEYALLVADTVDDGYFAVLPAPETAALFLSKLYIRRARRRHGLAAGAVEWMAEYARSSGLRTITLTVNKQNSSIAAYQRMGFVITDAVVTDIGRGFVMDDYRMQKILSEC